ncbi:hypothetical protein DFH01_09745 [Falsiroseomonas bella]|uniref:Uncharacterized protein n=1 Tax=Falsiroseomonas bella TaxID=2184016 RepID=A0A317FDI2_9PROT|nr:hypothetical protein [Falsiroseomonas bella]PWS37140.1 hypothetical protein DFH01_09745 [Falsiroseomonas bella]
MPPDPLPSGQQDPDAIGVSASRGAGATGFPTLEAAIAEVRALHPAWPATLVREVAGRLVGIVAAARNPDPPPAQVLAGLALVVSPGAIGDAATQADGRGDG